METMDKIKDMIIERKALLEHHITEDKARYNDPFLAQHMRGRVAVEENMVEWLNKVLAALD